LSAENHAWFNKQPATEQARLNRIFQEYKLGVLELNNGKVVQAQVIDFDMRDYDTIPLLPDDREYNRARVKRETMRAIDDYYEMEDR